VKRRFFAALRMTKGEGLAKTVWFCWGCLGLEQVLQPTRLRLLAKAVASWRMPLTFID